MGAQPHRGSFHALAPYHAKWRQVAAGWCKKGAKTGVFAPWGFYGSLALPATNLERGAVGLGAAEGDFEAEVRTGVGKQAASDDGLALAQRTAFRHVIRMSSVAALLKEASKLDRLDRAELISSLLEDLDPNPHYVADEEAVQRLEELKSGRIKGLSEAEFWKACGRT